MKEIIEKLDIIKNEIILEKGEGKLRLFALIARTDLEGKWDILFSADWFKKNNSEEDMIYLIEKLKKQFGENFDFLSTIALVMPEESFIRQLAKAIIREHGEVGGEMVNLKISIDFTVKQIFLIALDFTGIDLEKDGGTESGPVAAKEASKF